jgi:FdhD protein
MIIHRPLARLAFGQGRASDGFRDLPEEVAVAITYNGSTQAVMMATPANLIDFAYGFSLTEGIATPAEIDTIEIVETELGVDLQIWLHRPAEDRLAKRRRSMTGPVGCGLCGIDSLQEARRTPALVNDESFTLTPKQIMLAMTALTEHQPLHDVTHAAHAAAFWTPEQSIVAAREDVGRHNALDKLIGALAQHPHRQGALVLTCRTSIDMVQKAAAAGFCVIIAASAPTATAVEVAKYSGMTLIGLARSDRFEVFTHTQRIAPEETANVA